MEYAIDSTSTSVRERIQQERERLNTLSVLKSSTSENSSNDISESVFNSFNQVFKNMTALSNQTETQGNAAESTSKRIETLGLNVASVNTQLGSLDKILSIFSRNVLNVNAQMLGAVNELKQTTVQTDNTAKIERASKAIGTFEGNIKKASDSLESLTLKLTSQKQNVENSIKSEPVGAGKMVSSMSASVVGMGKNLKDGISRKLESLKTKLSTTALANSVERVRENIKDRLEKLRDGVKDTVSKKFDSLTSIFKKAFTFGKKETPPEPPAEEKNKAVEPVKKDDGKKDDKDKKEDEKGKKEPLYKRLEAIPLIGAMLKESGLTGVMGLVHDFTSESKKLVKMSWDSAKSIKEKFFPSKKEKVVVPENAENATNVEPVKAAEQSNAPKTPLKFYERLGNIPLLGKVLEKTGIVGLFKYADSLKTRTKNAMSSGWDRITGFFANKFPSTPKPAPVATATPTPTAPDGTPESANQASIERKPSIMSRMMDSVKNFWSSSRVSRMFGGLVDFIKKPFSGGGQIANRESLSNALNPSKETANATENTKDTGKTPSGGKSDPIFVVPIKEKSSGLKDKIKNGLNALSEKLHLASIKLLSKIASNVKNLFDMLKKSKPVETITKTITTSARYITGKLTDIEQSGKEEENNSGGLMDLLGDIGGGVAKTAIDAMSGGKGKSKPKSPFARGGNKNAKSPANNAPQRMHQDTDNKHADAPIARQNAPVSNLDAKKDKNGNINGALGVGVGAGVGAGLATSLNGSNDSSNSDLAGSTTPSVLKNAQGEANASGKVNSNDGNNSPKVEKIEPSIKDRRADGGKNAGNDESGFQRTVNVNGNNIFITGKNLQDSMRESLFAEKLNTSQSDIIVNSAAKTRERANAQETQNFKNGYQLATVNNTYVGNNGGGGGNVAPVQQTGGTTLIPIPMRDVNIPFTHH